MIFDTDVIIFAQRGNKKAARLIDSTPERLLSIQSYMELLQCANNKQQHLVIRSFIKDLDFEVLPISTNISHRAAVYIEEYSLSSGMRAGDALIAATAIEHNTPLTSANRKHFKVINDLTLKVFKP